MADEFPTQADKLRKLVKKSRQMPIGFGFNSGTTDDDDEYLAAHVRKAPEMLGKIAKSEGAGNKAAYGTFIAEGSEIKLTCFQTIPQLAKKFKKYLKTCKITLNVVVMDPDGNIIDSDVEVLEDWYRGDDADDDDDDDDGDVPVAPPPPQTAAPKTSAPPPPPPQATAAKPTAPPPPQPQAQKLDPGIAERAVRIRDMQGKLSGLAPDVAGRISPVLVQAAQLLREGRLADVDKALQQVAAVLARLQLAASQPKPAPAAAPEPAKPAEDPRLSKLREALNALRGQGDALPEAAAAPVLAVLDRAGAALDGGEAEAALAAMKEAQGVLRTAQEAKAKWDKAAAVLEGPVVQALKGGGLDDPADLKRRWDFAVALAAEGHWDRALATVPQIAAAVRQAATAPAIQTNEVPRDVVAFQKSRVLWVSVRQKMLSEADRLRDAIIAQSAEDEQAAEIAKAAEEIVAEVRQVDTRLQDILDEITNAAEGQGRAALKRQAAQIVGEYRTLIGAGVFRVIDSNPFETVSVAASARAALDQISRTLAA